MNQSKKEKKKVQSKNTEKKRKENVSENSTVIIFQVSVSGRFRQQLNLASDLRHMIKYFPTRSLLFPLSS